MLNIFKKQEDVNKVMARREFDLAIFTARTANPAIQAEIAHAVNRAHTLFHLRFNGAFQRSSKLEQQQYLDSLKKMIALLKAKQLRHEAEGFRLFEMWVRSLVADDKDLSTHSFRELKQFSARDLSTQF